MAVSPASTGSSAVKRWGPTIISRANPDVLPDTVTVFMTFALRCTALTVRAMRQRYTRRADRLYLYESLEGSGFRAELPVDENDIVLGYQGVFRRIR